MADSSIQITRDEFYLLHFMIEEKCDDHLIQEGKKGGLNRTNEQCFYGFHQLDDPTDEAYNRSIKYVALSAVGDEIRQEKYGFRLDKYYKIKFDGRHLCKSKKHYNDGAEKISIGKKYLLAFLKFLEAETMGLTRAESIIAQ